MGFCRVLDTTFRPVAFCYKTVNVPRCNRQVLCPDLDNEEEGMWMADELESCAFAKLGEMKVVSS